jgi:hypothetical protein
MLVRHDGNGGFGGDAIDLPEKIGIQHEISDDGYPQGGQLLKEAGVGIHYFGVALY